MNHVVRKSIVTSLFPVFMLAMLPSGLSSQTVSLSSAVTPLPFVSSGPVYFAVDASQNIYYSGLNDLAKIPAGGGFPIVLVSGLTSLGPLAVDPAGNVFVIANVNYNTGTSSVVKIPAGGGTPIPVLTTYSNPNNIAIDAQSNVYISSAGTVWKVPADGTGTAVALPISVNSLYGSMAVDAAGDVYAINQITPVGPPSVSNQSFVINELPVNATSTITVGSQHFGTGYLVAVDSAGNVFFAYRDYSGDPFFSEQPAGNAPATQFSLGGASVFSLAFDKQGTVYAGVSYKYTTNLDGIQEIQRNGSLNFGNVNVCGAGQTQVQPCSETANLYYNVPSTVTLGTPVLTPGSSGDFTLGSANCIGTAPGVCSLNVTFTPSSSGLKTASVQLVDSTGNELTTTSISGTGLGTQLITSQTPGPLRNDYSGFVGFEFIVGPTPIQVYALGRYDNNVSVTSTHVLKLVQANGSDVPGGSTTVTTPQTGTALSGPYDSGSLATPVTLLANTTYFLVSQETAGGDQWGNIGPVTSTSAATVLAPVYTDGSGHYIPVAGLAGNAYGPVNLFYTSGSTSTALSASVTSPAAGASIAGNVSVMVSTTGPVATLQLQVDGVNQGSAVPVGGKTSPYTLNFDTTTLPNGAHTLTVVAADAQSHTLTSAPVSVTISNQALGTAAFVIGQSPVTLRNNYTGFVGLEMTVGSAPITVTALGRFVAPGDSNSHQLELLTNNGTSVLPYGYFIDLYGATPGQFAYINLASPVTLQANTSYFLLSSETAGGDPWYDFAPISTTSVANVTAAVYTDGHGNPVAVGSSSGESYVPVSFEYQQAGSVSLGATITSPQAGAVVSGGNVPVTVSTSGTFTSLQLQVDGVNQGPAVASSPLTLNTTSLTNGPHTLTVVIANGGATAVSPGVSITVNNATSTATAFITGETPSTLRNNYTGFVGMEIQVGATPLTVTQLGRLFVSGNTGSHTVELVQANGTVVPGGSVSVPLAGGTPGQFVYASLASSVTLAANTTYYLVSQETAGGDQWYDYETVTGTSAAQILGPVYSDGHGNLVLVSGAAGSSYVPVSFKYQ